MKKLFFYITKLLLVLAIILTAINIPLAFKGTGAKIPYSTFEEMAINGDIDKVSINGNSMKIYPYEGTKTYETAFIQSVDVLKLLEEQEIIITDDNYSNIPLFAYICILSILCFLSYVLSYIHAGGGIVKKPERKIQRFKEPVLNTASRKENELKSPSEIVFEKQRAAVEPVYDETIEKEVPPMEELRPLKKSEKLKRPESDIKEIPITEEIKETLKPEIEIKETPKPEIKETPKPKIKESKLDEIKETKDTKESVKDIEKEEPEELDFSDTTLPSEPESIDDSSIGEVYFDVEPEAQEEAEPPAPEINLEDDKPEKIEEKKPIPINATEPKKEENTSNSIKTVVPIGEKKKPVFEAPKPLKKSFEKGKKQRNQKPIKEEPKPEIKTETKVEAKKESEITKVEVKTEPKTASPSLNEDEY